MVFMLVEKKGGMLDSFTLSGGEPPTCRHCNSDCFAYALPTFPTLDVIYSDAWCGLQGSAIQPEWLDFKPCRQRECNVQVLLINRMLALANPCDFAHVV